MKFSLIKMKRILIDEWKKRKLIKKKMNFYFSFLILISTNVRINWGISFIDYANMESRINDNI
jgi:hypothetical protein